MITMKESQLLSPEERAALPESALSELHQMEWALFAEEHDVKGWKAQFTMSKIPGYWQLAEQHRKDYQAFINARKAVEQAERNAERAAEKAAIPQKSSLPKRVQKERIKAGLPIVGPALPKRKPGRPKGTTKPKVAPEEKICRACHKPIPRKKVRGRPAVYHDTCRP